MGHMQGAEKLRSQRSATAQQATNHGIDPGQAIMTDGFLTSSSTIDGVARGEIVEPW